jgi:hypothetical protein
VFSILFCLLCTGSGLANTVTTLLPEISAAASIAVDPVSENLFIFGDSVIRQLSMPTQAVSILAGAPGSSFSNGVGQDAVFGNTVAIVLSSNGNLYASDKLYKRVRQIVISTRVVSTLAGDGVDGRRDGVGTNSRFSSLGHIVTDSNDNLYVQDGTTVRKIVISSGNVTTLAGHNVPNVAPNFPSDNPYGLYFSRRTTGSGLLYVHYMSGVVTINVDNGLLDFTLMSSGFHPVATHPYAMYSNGSWFTMFGVPISHSLNQCHIKQYDLSGYVSSGFSMLTVPTTYIAGSATSDCSSVDGTGADIRVLMVGCSTADLSNGILYFSQPETQRIRALRASAPCSAGSYCPSGSSALNQGGPCPAGYYCRRGSDRIPCPAGTYCTPGMSAAAQALPCSAGKYCPSGSSTLDQGGLCPAGYYCAAGSDRATCSNGAYCPPGSTTPDQGGLCAVGFFCAAGADRVACSAGKYCPSGSFDQNALCTAGYYCAAGANRAPCSAGKYCPPGSATLDQGGPCTAGYYCAYGMDRAPCSPGQYCPAGSSTLNQGGTCAAGFYCAAGADRIPCSTGKYCPAGSESLDQGGQCTAGYYCSGGSDRAACSAGKYCPQGSSTLDQGGPCTAGYYCAAGADRAPCTAGMHCPPGSATQDQGGSCAEGFFCAARADREPCSAGKFCPPGSGTLDQGGMCTPGYACPGGGMIRMQCNAGLHAPEGSSSCTQCPRGLVTGSAGTVTISTIMDRVKNIELRYMVIVSTYSKLINWL